VVTGDDVSLSGGTAAFSSSAIGTWPVTLTGAILFGSDKDNYNLTSVATTTATISAAYRIVGFFAPVDMTPLSSIRYYNSVKGGQTVPLKFRVYSMVSPGVLGPEITSTGGISITVTMLKTCDAGVVDADTLPTDATGGTSLRYSEGQFIFNWAVPKTAGKCYRVYVQTADLSPMVGSNVTGLPVQEAYFKSK
jgi:hypothetical protein